MPFIGSYHSAMSILSSIGNGKCKGACKSSWIQNLKYALKTKTNPLHLTKKERTTMTKKIRNVSGRNAIQNHSKTLKRFQGRPSPSLPANQFCGKTKKGNDGNMYLSAPNKNNVCSWKRV